MSGHTFKEITQDTVWRANQRGTSGSWKALGAAGWLGSSLAVEVGVTSGVDLRDTWEAEMTGCGRPDLGEVGKAMR